MGKPIGLSTLQKIILISEVVGIENALLLCEAFKGGSVRFPETASLVKALRDREIIEEIKKGKKRVREYRNKRYDAEKLAKRFKMSKANIYFKVKRFSKLYKSIIAQGRDVEIL